MTDEVRYERVGAAAVLTIDRPDRRNAVDGPTAERLLEGVEDFEADDGARVLVLTGAGGISFCAGADLKALDTYAGRLSLPDGPMGFTRRTPTKPTIAAIGGWCLPLAEGLALEAQAGPAIFADALAGAARFAGGEGRGGAGTGV